MRRSAVASWAAAAAVGIVGIAFHNQHPPAPLADAVSCPGALEAASIAAIRLAPDMSVAALLRVANAVFVFSALVALVRVVLAGTGSVAIACGVGVAAAATSMFVPVMAPSGAAAVAVASATLLAVARVLQQPAESPRSHAARRRSLLVAYVALAACVAVTPQFALPLAAIAAWTTWLALRVEARERRLLWASVSLVFVLALPIAIALLLPALPTVGAPSAARFQCLMPAFGRVSPIGVDSGLGTVFTGIGPFALSLAALGAFSIRGQLTRAVARPFVLLAVIPLFIGSRDEADAVRIFSMLFVALWWLVALGLRDVVRVLGRGIARQAAAAVFLIAVPLFQLASLRDPAVVRPQPMGHDALTSHNFAALLRTIASDRVLIVDDAVTDILVRSAAATPTFVAKRLAVVSRHPEEITVALASHRVLAMPRAQLELQREGFRLQDQTLPDIPGLAEVLTGGSCQAVTASWATLPALVSSAQFALVAPNADAYHPIVVFLGSDRPLDAKPLGWPEPALRGFFVSRYDAATERDRQRLIDDVAVDAAPIGQVALTAPHVTRLELWRVPGAPLRLVVGLDHAPAAALTRTLRADTSEGVRVCPLFEHSVLRLQDVR